MNEEVQQMKTEMRAVTVSREYGSGGGEIAARLAQRLGWQLLDHQAVVRVAQMLNVSEADAEEFDECGTGRLGRIMSSLQMMQPVFPVAIPYQAVADPVVYHDALQRVIETALATGQVVIVGRGAQAHFRNRRDILHVRVVSPLEQRINYVRRREGLDEVAAHERIQRKDVDRDRYLHETYHCHPADAHLYDLVVNTAVLDLESAIDLMMLAFERKEAMLGVRTGKLGPVEGLEPYKNPPENLVVPKSEAGQK